VLHENWKVSTSTVPGITSKILEHWNHSQIEQICWLRSCCMMIYSKPDQIGKPDSESLGAWVTVQSSPFLLRPYHLPSHCHQHRRTLSTIWRTWYFIIIQKLYGEVNSEILWEGKREKWTNHTNQGSHTCLFPISLLTGLASAVNPAFWFRKRPFSPFMRGLLTLPGTFLLGEASGSAGTSNWRTLQEERECL